MDGSAGIKRVPYAAALVSLMFAAQALRGADWPGYGGPNADWTSPETNVFARWPPVLEWKVCVGEGYAGTAIDEGCVYSVGFAKRQARPTQRSPKKGAGARRQKWQPPVRQANVYCLDALTGQQRWSFACRPAPGRSSSWDGPRATPAVHNGRVYVLNQDARLYCLSKEDGDLIWARDLGHKPPYNYGYCTSPVIDGSLLFLCISGGLAVSVVPPYDTVWEHKDYATGFVSPILMAWPGRRVLVLGHFYGFRGVEPETGKELFARLTGDPDGPLKLKEPLTEPVLYGSKAFFSAGYPFISESWHIGDDGVMTTDWEKSLTEAKGTNALVTFIGAPVRLGDFVYGMHFTDATLRCMDIRDGNIRWQSPKAFARRSAHRGNDARIVAVDGVLLVLDSAGMLRAINATPETYDSGGRAAVPCFTSGEYGETYSRWYAPMAFANGRLYTRSHAGWISCLRIADDRPRLILAGHHVDDADDGILSPGETAKLNVTLANAGKQSAAKCRATLTSADPHVSVIQGTAEWPAIPGRQTAKALTPFVVTVDAGCPSSRALTFDLDIATAGDASVKYRMGVRAHALTTLTGKVTLDGAPARGAAIHYLGWDSGVAQTDARGVFAFAQKHGPCRLRATVPGALDSEAAVLDLPRATVADFSFRTGRLSGTVTDSLTGAPLAGAAVEYQGPPPMVGTLTTDANGRFTLSHVYGRAVTLDVTARKDGYVAADTQAVMMPADRQGLIFALSYPRIDVTPTSIQLTSTGAQPATHTMRIGNLGAAPLDWWAWAQCTDKSRLAGTTIRELPFPAGVAKVSALAHDGSHLWMLVNRYDPEQKKRLAELSRIDPTDGSVLRTIDVTASAPHGGDLTWDGEAFWLLDSRYEAPRVVRIDPTDGKPSASHPLPGPGTSTYRCIAWDRNQLLVIRVSPELVISAMAPDTGQIVNSVTVSGDIPMAPAHATMLGASLWMAPSREGRIVRVDPRVGAVLSSWALPGEREDGMTADALGNIWLAFGGEKVLRSYASGIPTWLSLDSHGGRVAGLGTGAVAVTVTVNQPLERAHEAILMVASRDARKPVVQVPVTVAP